MTITTTKSENWLIDTADSFESAVDYAAQKAAPSWEAMRPRSRHSDFDYSNLRTHSFEETVTLTKTGWKEGREKLSAGLDSANLVQTNTTYRAESLDVAGAYPIIPAYIAGDPLHMATLGDAERATRPIYRFIVSISTSSMVSGETMIRRGAAILSWIDRLEANGARCEIIIVNANKGRGNGPDYFVNFVAKRADEPLEIDRLAFILLHPSMLRRIGFGWQEKHEVLHASMGGSAYGRPDDYIPASLQVSHTVYFGRMLGTESQWQTPESAVAAVEQAIRNATSYSEEGA